MSLRDAIAEDMKTAMREKNQLVLSVCRLLVSEIDTNKKNGKEDELEVIELFHKKLVKALGMYPEDKVGLLKKEIDIVEKYIPARVTATDIAKVIKEVLASTDDRNFGKLMGIVMSKFTKVKADGALVRKLLVVGMKK